MKKTNKVFLFVLTVLTGLIILVWQSIQTERFGDLLSSRVSAYVQKKYKANVSFEKVAFGFFPITTELINVEVEYDQYYLSASRVGLTFGWRDIFSKDFSIGSVKLRDALVYLPEIKRGDNSTSISLREAFSIYKNKIRKEIPFNLRGLQLNNAIVNVGDNRIEAINSKFSFFSNILTVKMSVGFNKNLIKGLVSSELDDLDINGFSGEFQLTSDYVRLKEARILSENSFIQLSGKVFYNKSFQSVSLDSFLDLNKFKKVIPKEAVNPKILPRGSIRLSGVIDGNALNPRAHINVRGHYLKSDFYDINYLDADLDFKNGKLVLEKANGKIGRGELTLDEQVEVFNRDVNDYLYPDFFIDVKNINTNDLLFFLPKLDIARGFLSGPVRFGIKKNHLTMKTFEGFKISDFKLGEEDKIVISNPEYYLSSGSKIKVRYDGLVLLDGGLGFKNSMLSLKGKIGNGKVDVMVLPSVADLEAFGPISDVKLTGLGNISGTITGPFDDTEFNFLMSPNDAALLGFKLGSVDTEIYYSLDRNYLKIKSLVGNYKGLRYQGVGEFDFKNDKSPMNLHFNVKEGTWREAQVALYPIFEKVVPHLKDSRFNFNTNVHIRGGFDVSKMKVNGVFRGDNILWYAEDIESLETSYSLENSVLRFPDIKAQKVSGGLHGKANMNLSNGEYAYEGTLSNLRVKDVFYYRFLNLGLDGDVFAEFNGHGNKKEFSSRSHIRLINSTVDNYKLKDSILTVYNNKKDLFFSSSALGGEFKLEGYLNLDEKDKKLSTVNGLVDTSDIRSILGILSKHNISKEGLNGRVKATLATDFSFYDLKKLNLDLIVEKLGLEFPSINLPENTKPYRFEIKNGRFVKWNEKVSGKGIQIETEAAGDLGEEFHLTDSFEVNSSVLELFTDVIEKSDGSIRGTHMLKGNIEHFDQYMNVDGKKISYKAKKLPGLFSNVALKVHFEDDLVILEKISGKYGNGFVKGRGKIKLKLPFPRIDLSLDVEKTKIPLFKKSGIIVSGGMTLTGDDLPYSLNGNLAIIQGDVVDSMNEIASSAVENNSYQRFIPVGYIEGNVSFINTDLSVTSFSPIQIKNGMIDIGLGGNLKVFGSVGSPKLNGDLTIDNPENKFIFKGHEFVLSEGNIKFLDGVRKEPPELRFNGVARINDYDVYINVIGPSDSMNVEMSSNPPLSQGDILSLLTLGVTSDVSKNLGDRQRQSVTTLSIGTLLIDQLKINQSLNDSLGLRVSIQPEFIEDENKLLEGRVEDRNGGGRFRSSTVLKVQKRVSKKVNLSLSSTVGGSVDQSQEMNLNYKINKSWSLEGVYEVRSNDTLEQDLPDSAGVDVKLQWSF